MFDQIASAFAALAPETVALAMMIFFLAGIIKGVVGFGMPLFAISLLALTMPLTTAIAANVGPSLVTNVRQAFRGPYLMVLIKRLWPFLIPAIGLIWFGIAIQLRVNEAYPGFVLGMSGDRLTRRSRFCKVQMTHTAAAGKAIRLSAWHLQRAYHRHHRHLHHPRRAVSSVFGSETR
jgi:hypothetical protein